MATGRDLILLTGATGFIGFRVLVEALKAGYAVRCAVRSSQAIKRILATPSIRALRPNEHQLYWAFVPDMSVPGAYDEAVKGVKYIIHCAASAPNMEVREPAPTKADEAHVRTAVNSTCWLLQSARNMVPSTVQRIVVTSSIAAVLPPAYLQGRGETSGPIIDSESRLPTPPAALASGFGPHAASKVAALNTSERWVEHFRPSFDLVSIMPAWVWGRHELATTAEELTRGSSGVLIDLLRGKRSKIPVCGSFISVDDVATAHILVLNPQIPGNQSFILSTDTTWEDAKTTAQRDYPSAFEAGIFRMDGTQDVVKVPIDASKTQRVLGLEFRGFEDAVKEVVGQWLELSEGRQVA
ncbi:hypothetical protein ACHAQA_007722 [Verticillium albo-atrum]